MIQNIAIGFYSHYIDSPQLLQTEMAVIGYWHFTWGLHGWKTKMLTPNDIDWSDPDAIAFLEGVSKHPSDCNHPEYNLACWMRWLAFKQYYKKEVRGGHIFCGDYDIFNYGLRPDDDALSEYTKFDICSFTLGWGNCLANFNGISKFCDDCSGELPDEAIQTQERLPPTAPEGAQHTSDLFVAAYKCGYIDNGQARILDERICKHLINGAHNLVNRQCKEWGEKYDRNNFMVHIDALEKDRGIPSIKKGALTEIQKRLVND